MSTASTSPVSPANISSGNVSSGNVTPGNVSRTNTGKPWELWITQILTILRVDLKKNFLSRRGSFIYLLALAPVVIIGLHALSSPHGKYCTVEQDTEILAGIFQLYYLRLGIFFGCMGIFTWLFRGEIIERSLHYYFLAPVRREVLVIGKFFAGAFTAIIFFGTSVLLSFVVMYGHFGAAGSLYVFNGPGFEQLLAYLGITTLACIGYGSMFLALSLIWRNPIIPAAVMLGWETFSAAMPSLLQRLSVTFYLKHLCPVSIPAQGFLALFTVVAEPVAVWISVSGLLLLSTAVLAAACYRMRKIEISYVTD